MKKLRASATANAENPFFGIAENFSPACAAGSCLTYFLANVFKQQRTTLTKKYFFCLLLFYGSEKGHLFSETQ